MIDSQKLVNFIEIAKTKNFRAAASNLNLSQPALSRSIQRLEEQMGVKLFHRTTKKVSLTVFGEALLQEANTIVNMLGNVDHVINDLKGFEAGKFTVGFGPLYSELFIPRSVGKFSTQYPKVRICSKVGRFIELVTWLKNEQVDLFIGETSMCVPAKEFQIIPLRKRTAVYCCRADHPIFNSKSIDHTLVLSYPLVACHLPYRLLPNIQKSFTDIYTDDQTFIHSNIVCDLFYLSKQISIHSDAICVTPENLITAELEKGELRIIDFKHEPITSMGGIVHLANRDLSPAAKKFVEIVCDLDENL